MPLLDHFHPPVSNEIQWNSFHSAWTSFIANALNDVVPTEFRVHESLKLGGGLEIDVAAVQSAPGMNGMTSPRHSSWQPSTGAIVPATFPDRFEVLVFRQFGGRQLVAAIELISPGNKDRDETREAFAMKVASYLHEGVSVLIVDVVTERRANLHDEIVRMMRMPTDLCLPPDQPLYAASYRPVIRENRAEIDIWVNSFSVGDPLPTMPLRLIADYFVPVELEATYTEACRRRRLIP
ncbi:MAG TPA: DUF4058 family protein [Gemmata sp.]|nr:DUF4058 family protein [Gemmata sp.]